MQYILQQNKKQNSKFGTKKKTEEKEFEMCAVNSGRGPGLEDVNTNTNAMSRS